MSQPFANIGKLLRQRPTVRFHVQQLIGQDRLARLRTRPGHHELPKADQLHKTSFVVRLYWLFGVLPGGAVKLEFHADQVFSSRSRSMRPKHAIYMEALAGVEFVTKVSIPYT
jgi:hypothetical protein